MFIDIPHEWASALKLGNIETLSNRNNNSHMTVLSLVFPHPSNNNNALVCQLLCFTINLFGTTRARIWHKVFNASPFPFATRLLCVFANTFDYVVCVFATKIFHPGWLSVCRKLLADCMEVILAVESYPVSVGRRPFRRFVFPLVNCEQ